MSVVDRDGEQAREHARRQVATYLSVVGGLDPTFELDPELIAALAAHLAGGNAAAAARSISGEILDRFAFAGTPRQVAERAEAAFFAKPAPAASTSRHTPRHRRQSARASSCSSTRLPRSTT